MDFKLSRFEWLIIIAGCIASMIVTWFEYDPKKEHRPGLIAKLFYIIAGAVGVTVTESIKNQYKNK